MVTLKNNSNIYNTLLLYNRIDKYENNNLINDLYNL